MAYSTIIKKKCKCQECTDNPDKAKYPTMSCEGYAYSHMPEDVKERVGTKSDLARKKKNSRTSQAAKLRTVQNEVEGSDKWKGDLWFAARHFEMTGLCVFCGNPSCKGLKEFKNSVAHLFAKALFPSIKWHPDNWIELCFYGNSCHTNFDNAMIPFEELKNKIVWFEIIRKTKILYPLLTNQEQGRVPQILIDEVSK